MAGISNWKKFPSFFSRTSLNRQEDPVRALPQQFHVLEIEHKMATRHSPNLSWSFSKAIFQGHYGRFFRQL